MKDISFLTRKFTSIAAISVTSLVFVVYLWFSRIQIGHYISKLPLSAKDVESYQYLEDIEIALNKLERDLTKIEVDVTRSDLSSLDVLGEHKKNFGTKLGALSSNLDFLFGELDQVRGNQTIKDYRRLLSDRMNKIASRLDKLSSLLQLK